MLINFLVFLFILNSILLQPLLKIFKERDDTVKGDLDAAKDMSDQSERKALQG